MVLLCFLSRGRRNSYPIHPSSVQLVSRAGGTFPVPMLWGHKSKATLSALKHDAWFPHQAVSRWTHPPFPSMCLQSCPHSAPCTPSSPGLSLNPTPRGREGMREDSTAASNLKQSQANCALTPVGRPDGPSSAWERGSLREPQAPRQ